jgi:DNA-binding HxlR family transcriptional regulator
MWTLVALRSGPMVVTRLRDSVRALDGPIGPGTLLAAIGRLERLRLVERTSVSGRAGYGLTERGSAAMAAALAVQQAGDRNE